MSFRDWFVTGRHGYFDGYEAWLFGGADTTDASWDDEDAPFYVWIDGDGYFTAEYGNQTYTGNDLADVAFKVWEFCCN